MSCKNYPEMKSLGKKHLRMQVFHENKDSRSKDQNKKETDFISPAIKTNVNRISFMAKRTFMSNLMLIPSKTVTV